MKAEHIKICGLVVKDMLKGKYIALNAYARKEKKS